ncbi:hypothetical protein WJX72_010138 [[Myrmecia] bisecta]|uniref:LisH domain-containing protein n=1 Tax=[Myrmecia] bisecta TaxID=41462 RepID=A0AAW1QSG8_9CHLO
MSASETSPGVSDGKWETGQMLDVYILDYLKKRGLHASVSAFTKEVNIPNRALAIDAPSGFLFEWWSVFWDIFMARSTPSYSEAATNYVDTQKMRAAQQSLQMQQLQVQHIARLQQQFQAQNMARERGQALTSAQSPGVSMESMQKGALQAGAAKMQEERLRQQQLQAMQAMQGLKPGLERGNSNLQAMDPNTRQMLAAMTANGAGMQPGQVAGLNAGLAQQQAFARGLQQQQQNSLLAERLQSMNAAGMPWNLQQQQQQQQAMLQQMMGPAGAAQRQQGLMPHMQGPLLSTSSGQLSMADAELQRRMSLQNAGQNSGGLELGKARSDILGSAGMLSMPGLGSGDFGGLAMAGGSLAGMQLMQDQQHPQLMGQARQAGQGAQSNGQGGASGGPTSSGHTGQPGSPDTSTKAGHGAASQQAGGKGKGGKGASQTSRKRKANAGAGGAPPGPLPDTPTSDTGSAGNAALFAQLQEQQQQAQLQQQLQQAQQQAAQQAAQQQEQQQFGDPRMRQAQMLTWGLERMPGGQQVHQMMGGQGGEFGNNPRSDAALMMGQFAGLGSSGQMSSLDGMNMAGLDDPLDADSFASLSKQGFNGMNGLIDSADMELFMGNDADNNADERDAATLLGGLDELNGMDLMPKGSQGQ